MSSQDNTLWKYALIGAGALVSASLVIYLVANQSGGNKKCLAEIDQLGAAQKDANGVLSFGYYKDIFMIISKHAK